MTAYHRRFQPGRVYFFFTVVTERRHPLLIDRIHHLRRAFRIGLERRPVQIDAILVLPDHLHALWRLPEGDQDFSTRWMTIKRLFSAALPAGETASSKHRRREKGIWQRRFREHLIRDETDWRRYMDYIHYNPVKHGYCAAPIQWPYGSFARCVASGLYAQDWGRETLPALADLELE